MVLDPPAFTATTRLPLVEDELEELLLDELLELELLVLEVLLVLEELLLDELEELLELVVSGPQAPSDIQDASLPGTVVVYQFAWYKLF